MASTFALVGFEDWLKDPLEEGKFLPNPGRLLIEQAKADPRAWLEASGCDALVTALFPVPSTGELANDLQSFRRPVETFLKDLPSGSLALGLGQGHLIQRPVRLETQAMNQFSIGSEAKLPVVEGDQLKLLYSAHVREQLETCLGLSDLSGQVELSMDAGRYYCNALLYLLECLPGRWFAHLPAFLVGYEAQATAYWNQYASFFEQKYPGKGPQDISFGRTEEQARLLQAFLRATRGTTAV